jgi:hypothetical protein
MRVKILTKDSDKQVLIKRLADQKMALMFFYEEEPGEGVLHEKVDEFITLVHPPYDYDTLEKGLYLGNWQAVFPSHRHCKPFNTFKAKDSEIEQRMSEAKVKLVIDSFHDDINWNVIEES